jgi:catecholate siderophore receptor
MAILALVGVTTLLAGVPNATPSAGALARPDTTHTYTTIAADTTVRLRFSIPARPLGDALSEFSRQAGVRVELERASAAGVWSRAVAGTYTSAEALRQLLGGTGLLARFTEGEASVVIRSGTEEVPVYTLAPLMVIGAASRGYATQRTSTATRTDTPLRDTPQSVSVVTRQLMADQAMQGMSDLLRYVPGATMGQGEGHRDAPTIRGNSSTANFFVNGVRDDAQYFRDLYNVERVEALKGANAMVFGRGGGGGVINRVSKGAQWVPVRTLVVEGGSFDHKRATVDLGQGFGAKLAARLNGMYEESGGFRDAAELRRYGLNPTLAVALGPRTTVHAGYEYLDDARMVDRGLPSFQGRPSPASLTTFFGNPAINHSTLALHAATASLEHVAGGGLTVRNRSRFADYDKFYQNSYPGAVDAGGTEVSLSAYSHATGRRNLFNQTDLIYEAGTGAVRHTLLLGGELGRQETKNFRRTGIFNDSVTSIAVPFDRPTVAVPVTFRQSATDADNRTTATVAALYFQDQLEISRHWQAVVGLRYDRFAVDFHNNRNGEEFGREDHLLSPRAGLVFKPAESVSLYGGYSIAHLPSSGDQFASLSATTRLLEPERFTNQELGAKWEPRPNLALTAAVYRLDRTNTAAPDPADPARTVQTGSQRTTGFELEGSGNLTTSWQVVGGFAIQRAEIRSATSAARAGARVPLVPQRTFSLWNRYQLFRPLGLGLGVVHQSEMYAAIDNTVTLPDFTRLDGALFLRLGPLLGAQVNVENLLDERYYGTSHGNNNIMPGAPRTLRISLTAGR